MWTDRQKKDMSWETIKNSEVGRQSWHDVMIDVFICKQCGTTVKVARKRDGTNVRGQKCHSCHQKHWLGKHGQGVGATTARPDALKQLAKRNRGRKMPQFMS